MQWQQKDLNATYDALLSCVPTCNCCRCRLSATHCKNHTGIQACTVVGIWSLFGDSFSSVLGLSVLGMISWWCYHCLLWELRCILDLTIRVVNRLETNISCPGGCACVPRYHYRTRTHTELEDFWTLPPGIFLMGTSTIPPTRALIKTKVDSNLWFLLLLLVLVSSYY